MILQQPAKFFRYFFIVTAIATVLCSEVTLARPFVGGGWRGGGAGFYGRGFARPFFRPFFRPYFNPVVAAPFVAPYAPYAYAPSYAYSYPPAPYYGYGASTPCAAATPYAAAPYAAAPYAAAPYAAAPSYGANFYVNPNSPINSYSYGAASSYVGNSVSYAPVGPTSFYAPYPYNNGPRFY